MTPEQFIKEVTGRKIRWSNWDNDRYVVPTGKWFDRTYNSYWCKFECINKNNKKRWYFIYEGFSKDKCGSRWEYVEDFERYLELLDL